MRVPVIVLNNLQLGARSKKERLAEWSPPYFNDRATLVTANGKRGAQGLNGGGCDSSGVAPCVPTNAAASQQGSGQRGEKLGAVGVLEKEEPVPPGKGKGIPFEDVKTSDAQPIAASPAGPGPGPVAASSRAGHPDGGAGAEALKARRSFLLDLLVAARFFPELLPLVEGAHAPERTRFGGIVARAAGGGDDARGGSAGGGSSDEGFSAAASLAQVRRILPTH